MSAILLFILYRLVETLTLLGKSLGCYKMSLECKDENTKFYESFGYVKDGQYFMVQRFKDWFIFRNVDVNLCAILGNNQLNVFVLSFKYFVYFTRLMFLSGF